VSEFNQQTPPTFGETGREIGPQLLVKKIVKPILSKPPATGSQSQSSPFVKSFQRLNQTKEKTNAERDNKFRIKDSFTRQNFVGDQQRPD